MKAFALFENGTDCKVVATLYAEDQEPVKATVLGQSNVTVKASAQRGASAAANVLRALRWIQERDRYFVSFEFVGEGSERRVLGESAALLFALKFAGDLIEQRTQRPFAFAVAGTGVVADHTAAAQVEAVQGINPKLAAALEVLEPGDKLVYPKENDQEVDPVLTQRAAEKGIHLVPVATVDEALRKVLEIKPTNNGKRRFLRKVSFFVPLVLLLPVLVWGVPKLNRELRTWIPPWVRSYEGALLSITLPKAGGIITPTTEVQVQAAALTADIHLLALDPANPTVYRYLGKIPPPPLGQEDTLTYIIDTSQLGLSGRPFRLVALSASQLEPTAEGIVERHAIPQAAPRDEVEVRHAGVILSPTQGAVVSGVGTVRAKVFLPNTYAAAVIRPEKEGSWWVQNDGLRVTSSTEFSIQVNYGGRDTYEVYIGVTSDPDLFKDGDRLDQSPRIDSKGQPVYWIGPVKVTHE